MISLTDYWMGRDATHPLDMSPQIERNALLLLELVNKLLVIANTEGVRGKLHPKTGTVLSSGWRPPAVNAATPRAAKASLHMTGQAIDLYDPDEEIDAWLFRRTQVLIDIGLWVEHKDYTPRWAHLQSLPPPSRNRYFIPR